MRRGHVGTGQTAYITFYFRSHNALAAMRRGQKMKGVKHAELPIECKEITKEEYSCFIGMSAYERAYAR